jgi:hypothetical protein
MNIFFIATELKKEIQKWKAMKFASSSTQTSPKNGDNALNENQ